MTKKERKEELLEKLRQLQKSNDVEVAHGDADDLLLEWINDVDIGREWGLVPKWYA